MGFAPAADAPSNTHQNHTGQAPIKVTGQKGFATNQLFKSRTLSFESLGIGGLDSQFENIFRRAFASRVFPPAILERLGIHHVKVGAGWGVGRAARAAHAAPWAQSSCSHYLFAGGS